MEISVSQTLLILASLLLPFTWLLLHLLSPSPRERTNGGHGRRIPTPPALPIIGHLHLLRKPLHHSLAALAKRYAGDAGLLHLRFGSKPVVLITSPSVAGECFTVHDVALADRPGLASRRLLTEDCPAIGMTNYGELWRLLRRLATVHALCPHRLAATAAARDAEARAMAAKLFRRARFHGGAGVVVGVKVKETAYQFVANVVMAMVAGKRMEEEEVVWFKEMTEAGLEAAGAANRHDSLPVLRMMDFGRTRRRLAGLAMARREFGQSILDDYRRRRGSGGEDDDAPRTVVGDLLRQQEEERSPEMLDDVVIRSVCLSLLQAGTDTSSSTIEWAMALLLNNPDILTKATIEIHSIVGTSRLLQESDLAVLPYLQSIITETLRLKPLAPSHIPHEASRDCVITGSYPITRGTMVLVDVYSLHRDPTVWEDPERFLPERFMGGGGGGGGEEGDERRWMMPFGMGRRRCPGEALTVRMMGVALGVMVQCFEWGRVRGEEVDLREGSGLTMPMEVPLVATCHPRVEMEALLMTL